MEAVIQNGITDCISFIAGLNSLDSRLNEQLNFLDKRIEEMEERCRMTESDLNAESASLEAEIASLSQSLQQQAAATEELRSAQLAQKQKVLNLQAHCSNTEFQIDNAEDELNVLKTRIEPRQDVSIFSPREYNEVILPGTVFDNILSYLTPRCLYLLETVCTQWHYAIATWPGWNLPQEYIPGEQIFNLSTHPTRTNYPRFIMTIDIEPKRSLWNVTVEGKHTNNVTGSAQNITHKKNRVQFEVLEDSRSQTKEYNVCDVIIKNNHKLAQIKVDTSRLRAKLDTNTSIKTAFKMQTQILREDLSELLRKNHLLDTQLNSDAHTLNFLRLRHQELSTTLSDLKKKPLRIRKDIEKKEQELDEHIAKQRERELDQVDKALAAEKSTFNKVRKKLKKENKEMEDAKKRRDQLHSEYQKVKAGSSNRKVNMGRTFPMSTMV